MLVSIPAIIVSEYIYQVNNDTDSIIFQELIRVNSNYVKSIYCLD